MRERVVKKGKEKLGVKVTMTGRRGGAEKEVRVTGRVEGGRGISKVTFIGPSYRAGPWAGQPDASEPHWYRSERDS